MSFFNSLPSKFPIFIASLILFTHVLLGGLSGNLSFVSTPSPLPAATSTSAIVTKPPVLKTETTPKTTLPPPSVAKPISAPSAPMQTAPTLQSIPSISANDLNTQTRAALVNILCTTAAGGYFEPISGSGVFIDTRGVILTNAHVAQYFLLQNYPEQNDINCVVRAGSPAQALYHARLIYLPPEWVNGNADEIISIDPKGTGENDYAFLLVTGTTDPNGTLPSSFPALPMTVDPPSVGDQVLLAAYPASLLDGEEIQSNLYISSALSQVEELLTFSTSTIDLVSLAPTVVSQTGSSGGAVTRGIDGKLLGIISTETTGTTTADRSLHAITIGYIDRSLGSDGLGGLVGLLNQNLSAEADAFASTTAPTEEQELLSVLPTQ